MFVIEHNAPDIAVNDEISSLTPPAQTSLLFSLAVLQPSYPPPNPYIESLRNPILRLLAFDLPIRKISIHLKQVVLLAARERAHECENLAPRRPTGINEYITLILRCFFGIKISPMAKSSNKV